MTGTITLDDIDIVRDSNSNLVIRDDTDTTIATYDTTANEWQFADNVDLSSNQLLNAVLAAAEINDLKDATSGATVYDSSAEEVVADVNNQSVRTGEVSLTDSATNPSTNGEFRRNGTDAKVYSGGAVRNLSNIGSGGGDVSVSDDGTQVIAAASNLNFRGISVADDGDGTVTIGDTLDMGSL